MATSTPLELDLTFGGLYAGASLEISEAAAAHFNAAAARATGGPPDGFRPFVPGEAFTIGCPTRPTPRDRFIDAYQRLRAVIDGEIEIRLADHPHEFSAALDDAEMIRAVPTYVSKSAMPDGFFGRAHRIELFQDDRRIFGPVERFFHSSTSGAVFHQVEDGPGRLVVEVRGDLAVLAERGAIVGFTDPAFGVPTAVSQLDDDGSSTALDWRRLGLHQVGDVPLFHEWIALGIRPRGERLVVEIRLPNRGTGLAVALFSGHTRDTAFRTDATVL